MNGKVILFTNVRDEKNLKEWVSHHLMLGDDFITQYNNDKVNNKLIRKYKEANIEYYIVDAELNLDFYKELFL